MAIEQSIKRGDQLLDEKDYLGAISSFSKAILESPKAFHAFIKRSIAFQKLNNYDKAKSDISEALILAEERGKRAEVALCYFRLGLIYIAEKRLQMALKNLEKAIEYNCTEPTVEIWKNKVEHDLKKQNSLHGLAIEDEPLNDGTDAKSNIQQKSSTSIEVINKHAPINTKIRDDWYQTSEFVIITIYAKNIKEEKLQIQFHSNSVSASFPSSSSSEYNYNLEPLYSEIDTSKSTFKVYSTKIEIMLAKKYNIKWPTLEASRDSVVRPHVSNDSQISNNVGSYPTSSKKSVNWANFKLNEEDSLDEEQDVDFFSKLYKDVDDDTKRAMMKSYVESNGTVLTTNWAEAKDKKFETSPPEGMISKSWND